MWDNKEICLLFLINHWIHELLSKSFWILCYSSGLAINIFKSIHLVLVPYMDAFFLSNYNFNAYNKSYFNGLPIDIIKTYQYWISNWYRIKTQYIFHSNKMDERIADWFWNVWKQIDLYSIRSFYDSSIGNWSSTRFSK